MSERVTIGDCTLYRGDCREVLPGLGKIDAVVTDPPYGIGRVWKGGGGHGWGKAKQKSGLRNHWDANPADPAMLASLLALNVPTIIWGGNHFGLPPSRGWLVWRKEVNPALTLGDAELAWTNLDKPVRVFDHPRNKLSGKQAPEHPTQKPLPLMDWCLARIPAAAVILDPYMGSATTGLACVRAGKAFVGVELERRYFDIACRRIEAALRQGDMLAEVAA